MSASDRVFVSGGFVPEAYPHGAIRERTGDELRALREQRPSRIEIDPHGKAPSEPGAKMDAVKPKAGVLLDFSRALEMVAIVGTYGANKYSRGGWQEVDDGVTRYTDAMMRHLLKEYEVEDQDSGLPHAAQVAWNALARLELMLREGEK